MYNGSAVMTESQHDIPQDAYRDLPIGDDLSSSPGNHMGASDDLERDMIGAFPEPIVQLKVQLTQKEYEFIIAEKRRRAIAM